MIGQIEALRYKCFYYIGQKLRPFQILVGPNASGKSTFLDIPVFLQDILRSGVQEALRKRARSVRELTWQMQPEGFEFAIELQIPDPIVKALKKPYTRVRYEVRIAPGEEGSLTLPVENLWLVRGEGRTTPSDGRGQLSPFPVEPSPPPRIVIDPGRHTPPGYHKVMSRTTEGRIYIRSETTKWSFHLAIGRDRSGLTLIPEENTRFPVSTWVRHVLAEGIQFLQLNGGAMRWPCRPDAPRTFQPDGSNLPLVVERLAGSHPGQLDRWVRHLRSVLPEIVGIEVREREEDRHRYLVVKTRDGRTLPSWLLSDGTLRLFALTLLAYLPPEEKGIYIVEEPENGIHPKALEAVYRALSSVYGGQVLCATHSHILLNLARPEELLYFERRL